MDGDRKRPQLIAAAILAGWKLIQYEGPARVPATIYAIGGSDPASGTDPHGDSEVAE